MASERTLYLNDLLAGKSPSYPASWLDRFNAWIENLPVPAFFIYLALYVLLAVIPSSIRWAFGLLPFGTFGGEFIYTLFTLEAFYFNYVSYGLARNALRRFRPLLDISASGYRNLEYEFVFLPAAIINLLTAFSLVSGFLAARSIMFMDDISAGNVIAGFIGFSTGLLAAVVLVYRMVHQMRWVSKVYGLVKRIDLFNLGPIYALSSFTATMSLIFLLILYSNLLQDPNYATNIVYLWGSAIVSAIALAGFALPLLGINRRLVDAKASLMRQSGEEVRAAFERLAREQKSNKLTNIVSTRQLVDAVVRKREFIQGIPTWPWQPATFRSLLAGVLLPVVIWLVQQALGRLIN